MQHLPGDLSKAYNSVMTIRTIKGSKQWIVENLRTKRKTICSIEEPKDKDNKS